MTFDATPPDTTRDLPACTGISVCDLTGAERFLVWAVRWESSLHDDESFAAECLLESFERAGLADLLPVFRSYVTIIHGARSACPPSARLGCWRINSAEATTLHAVACLQSGRFGEAWRAVSRLCSKTGAARAMLSLGELAESLAAVGGRVRTLPDLLATVTPDAADRGCARRC
jgi:hypothetical protein